ncbi:HAD superfamily hydrolase [Catenulispora acidiphila DSM 44928]|uniref:HAD superfamily hydrolase n=1 Tax=Catenulispora acidiphila (strain DSM 44928 / JCM 14897 / NBRC 102108 / NRRL B-24433 / ID139908) TaxID=479433 RepID=C7PVU6_CATAD|nr:HAD family hydrolase [Catenulispora acidiphila]ACU71338.1 HAD superfamily hydrolase [Catenulispora acidiphila DSM 44928]
MAELTAPEPTAPDRRPILVVDFDGTVYRDDSPVRFYAEHAAGSLPAEWRGRFLDLFEAYLERGIAAADRVADEAAAAVLRGSVDAWGAAAGLAALSGVAPAATEEAFLASRQYMLTAACQVTAVPALVEAIEKLRGKVRVVLATNSPAGGLAPLLERLGIGALFAEVVSGANKPEGLRRWIAAELAGREPGELFSLGDHYVNEIEPAMAVGARAGYIDRFGRADGPATVTAAVVEDILPGVFAWARALITQ